MHSDSSSANDIVSRPLSNGGPNEGTEAETSVEDWELWMLLNQVADAMARARQGEVRPLGVPLMQVAVIALLKRVNRPISPTELSRWLFREPNTISELLSRMQKQGLIRRDRKAKDANTRISLTKKGKELSLQGNVEGRVIHRIFSNLSVEDRSTFRGLLHTLLDGALHELTVRPQANLPSIEGVLSNQDSP